METTENDFFRAVKGSSRNKEVFYVGNVMIRRSSELAGGKIDQNAAASAGVTAW